MKSKPLYILNFQQDPEKACFDENDLLDAVLNMHPKDKGEIYKLRYSRDGKLVGHDSQTQGMVKPKELEKVAEQELECAPKRTKKLLAKENMSNYHARISYPADLYFTQGINHKNHPDKILEQTVKAPSTGSGMGMGGRDLGFNFGKLAQVEQALWRVAQLPYGKKVKVDLYQNFFDNQGFSLYEQGILIDNKSIVKSLSELQKLQQPLVTQPKPKKLKP